ncbi:uncharacterized protein EI90DRAFT_3123958 [Cantharellus anzutake]|uniref:uncharacterized protein n=1 Tax=Cantharellus anzutake TaxID=1750568 RepID=UPI001908DFDE|nr:uncharacterized protein EI90DRAFT_3123958 [Cantharellus anzutake]KAF8330735.1 hypothetical protein EI90DRAFT_3123958 [Cantharellus anzutake]
METLLRLNLVSDKLHTPVPDYSEQVGAAGVIDDAPGDVCDLHARYFELKFEGGGNPSTDDFDKRYGYVQRTPEILNEAGMKYILLSLWRHHPSNEARACRVANMTAFKFSKLHVGDYPVPPPPPSWSGHFMPEPAPPVPPQKTRVSLSQLMDGNYGHLLSYPHNLPLPFRYSPSVLATHLLLTSPTLSPSAPILISDRTPPLSPPSYYSAPPSQHLHPPVILLRFPRPLRYSPSDLTTLLSATPSSLPFPSLLPLLLLCHPSAKLRPSTAVPYFALGHRSYLTPSPRHSPYLGL